MSELNGSDDSGLVQVYLWIFEHACKHNMECVIKRILEEYQASTFIKKALETWEGESPAPIHPEFLFKFFMKNLIGWLTNERLENSSVNFDLLKLVVDMLQVVYRKAQFMTVRNFSNLVSRLKLLELICRIQNRDPLDQVMACLANHFPRWDSQLEKILMQRFDISSADNIQSLKKSHISIRNYILKLLSCKTSREQYLKDIYKIDVVDILNYTTKHLASIVVADQLPDKTAIEQLLNGGCEDFRNIDCPAIQILLDNLTSNMIDRDFLAIVELLSPGVNIPLLKSCFQSESLSLALDAREMNSVEKVEKWLGPNFTPNDLPDTIKRINCKRFLNFETGEQVPTAKRFKDSNNPDDEDNLPQDCSIALQKRGDIQCGKRGKVYQLYS